jgi:hypothetical protein
MRSARRERPDRLVARRTRVRRRVRGREGNGTAGDGAGVEGHGRSASTRTSRSLRRPGRTRCSPRAHGNGENRRPCPGQGRRSAPATAQTNPARMMRCTPRLSEGRAATYPETSAGVNSGAGTNPIRPRQASAEREAPPARHSPGVGRRPYPRPRGRHSERWRDERFRTDSTTVARATVSRGPVRRQRGDHDAPAGVADDPAAWPMARGLHPGLSRRLRRARPAQGTKAITDRAARSGKT